MPAPSLGSRAWINPFTGAYPRDDSATPNNNHSGPRAHRPVAQDSDGNQRPEHNAESRRDLLRRGDSTSRRTNMPGARRIPAQCNMYNNVSYRRYNVNGTGSPFTFSPASATTVRAKTAIAAWTGATTVEIKPDPGNDGVGTIAYKVTNPSPGVWHYEYAIYNQNLDRAIQSFSVPVGAGVTLSNIGFHAPPQHPGWAVDGTVGNAGYSSAPWTQTQAGGSMTWSSETFAQNPNANAIRWGTLYNFRFDSNRPPQTVSATIGFFKTGAPITVQVRVRVLRRQRQMCRYRRSRDAG